MLCAIYPPQNKDYIIHCAVCDLTIVFLTARLHENISRANELLEELILYSCGSIMVSFYLWPGMNLPLSLPLNECAKYSKGTRAGLCFTTLSKLTCGWDKCHNLIDAKCNNITHWSFNNMEIRFLSFHFIMIFPPQYANGTQSLANIFSGLADRSSFRL